MFHLPNRQSSEAGTEADWEKAIGLIEVYMLPVHLMADQVQEVPLHLAAVDFYWPNFQDIVDCDETVISQHQWRRRRAEGWDGRAVEGRNMGAGTTGAVAATSGASSHTQGNVAVEIEAEADARGSLEEEEDAHRWKENARGKRKEVEQVDDHHEGSQPPLSARSPSPAISVPPKAVPASAQSATHIPSGPSSTLGGIFGLRPGPAYAVGGGFPLASKEYLQQLQVEMWMEMEVLWERLTSLGRIVKTSLQAIHKPQVSTPMAATDTQ